MNDITAPSEGSTRKPGAGFSSAIRSMSPRTKKQIFGIAYVLTALMVICPPVYLAASGASPQVLGLPFSVFYMFLNAVLIVLLVCALWIVESIRSEHEVFETTTTQGEEAHRG